MQIHDDKQMQYASSDRLQGPAGHIDEDYFVIDRAAYNQGINAKYDMIVKRGGDAHVNSKRSPCGSCPYPSWNKVGALCATDYKWVQQEQVDQGKIIPVVIFRQP